MNEDDWLEAAYEDRNGGDVDTAVDDEPDDRYRTCGDCGEYVDDCICHFPTDEED